MATSTARRPPGGETTHDDIMRALSELKSETRVGFAQMNGRMDGMSREVAEVTASLQRNWEATDGHSRELVRLLTLGEERERSSNRATDPEAAIVIHPKMLRLASRVSLTVLVLVVIVAALAGVKIPGWVG